ncbi:Outer membrane protein assembly factor BamB [Candidatus Kinetoplastibacterium sorsogonicusi]|uniref:Outer membrane protein assembly factor BamB n=2 Tax=Candidatus Kinetoplastidibacterium kentomonadis TaxID=1576550 RepID=A0A3Q8F6M7_9PROT|nr:Outer membrane protein assembly factor BamB [Candidatus Kinetoplastibacterium sorsogonicusi]
MSCSLHNKIYHINDKEFFIKKTIINNHFFNKISSSIISIIIQKDYLYYAYNNGQISKLNIKLGKICWTNNINHQLISGICVKDNYIATITKDGYLFILDINGKIIWKKNINSSSNYIPIIHNDLVIIRTDNNKLKAFSIINKKLIWNIYSPLFDFNIKEETYFCCHNDLLIASIPDKKIIIIDLKHGNTIWDYSVPVKEGYDDIERINNVYSFHVINNILYIVSYNGDLLAIDLINQFKKIWHNSLNLTIKHLLVENKNLYITDQNNIIRCFNSNNCELLWKYENFCNKNINKPICIKNYLLVSDNKGYIYLLNKYSGTMYGNIKLNHYNNSFTLINDNSFIINSNNRKLSLVEIKNFL